MEPNNELGVNLVIDIPDYLINTELTVHIFTYKK